MQSHMPSESDPRRMDLAASLNLLRTANESFRRFFEHFAGVPVHGTDEEVEAMLQVERTLRAVGRFLNRDLKAAQTDEMREEIGRYRENLLRLHQELSTMQSSAHRSRARLFTREEHLQAAQAWCAATRSTR
jgi:hypothetical protein